MTDYWILSSTSMHDLIETVKSHLGQGWEPAGGVTMAMEPANRPGTPKQVMHYAQALVMRKAES